MSWNRKSVMPYQAELALQLSKLIMKKRGKAEKKQNGS